MSWHLNVSGHIAGLSKDLEHELAAELRKVLANPKFGVIDSWLSGSHVAGTVHEAPEEDRSVPEPEQGASAGDGAGAPSAPVDPPHADVPLPVPGTEPSGGAPAGS